LNKRKRQTQTGSNAQTAHKRAQTGVRLHKFTFRFTFCELVKPDPKSSPIFFTDDHILVERFENYWAGAPQLERVSFPTFADDEALYAALLTGEVNAIICDNPEIYDRLSASPDFIVCGIPTSFHAVSIYVAGFKCHPDGVMRFENVRDLDTLFVGLPPF